MAATSFFVATLCAQCNSLNNDDLISLLFPEQANLNLGDGDVAVTKQLLLLVVLTMYSIAKLLQPLLHNRLRSTTKCSRHFCRFLSRQPAYAQRAAGTKDSSTSFRCWVPWLFIGIIILPSCAATGETAGPRRLQVSGCPLPLDFQDLFLAAMEDHDTQLREKLVQAMDSIGFVPFGVSLPVSGIIDLKTDVVDLVLGTQEDRQRWFAENADAETFDLASILEKNGEEAGINITVACTLGTNGEGQLSDFSLQLGLTGSDELALESLSPEISILPHSFPPFDITSPLAKVTYSVNVSATIEQLVNRFTVDEIEARLHLDDFQASVGKRLEITASTPIEFSGRIEMRAEFYWKSGDGWDVWGSYKGQLKAEAGDSGDLSVANLALVAEDDNFFDDEPRK